MKPVSGLVVRFSLAGAIQILIQFLDFRLYALAPRNISARLLDEIPVLEVADFCGGIDLDNIHDVLADFLPAVEDGLDSPCVPVQKLLLDHVLDVIHNRGIEFRNDIVRRDLIEGGVDVQPPKHIVSDDLGFVVVFVQIFHLKSEKETTPEEIVPIDSAHSQTAMSAM